MVPSLDRRLTTWATQLMWRPWLVAAAHGHWASIAACIAQRAGSQSTPARADATASAMVRSTAPKIGIVRMPYPPYGRPDRTRVIRRSMQFFAASTREGRQGRASRAVGDLGFDQLGEQGEGFLPAQVARLGRNDVGDAFLHHGQLGA